MVTLQQYKKLAADHPRKFSASDVGFTTTPDPGYECNACFHFYEGSVAKRTVCEIYRPENGSVPPTGGCRFWTRDGKRHPLYQKTTPPPKRKEKEDAKDSE